MADTTAPEAKPEPTGLGRQYVRNVYTSWIALLLRSAIALVFIPYITSILGPERYGVWVILFQVAGYFSLMEVGLTSAVTRYVSRFLAQLDYQAINRVLSSAWVMLLIVGSAVIVVAALLVSPVLSLMQIRSPDLLREATTALLILAAFVAFNFWLLPFGNTLTAFQRRDLGCWIEVAEEAVRAGVLIWLLTHGYGLIALALALVVLTVLKHAAGALVLNWLHPQARVKFSSADRETAMELLRYARISFGISLCWLLLFNLDSILLGAMVSVAAAGVFRVGAQLINQLRLVLHGVGSPLIPAISQLDAQSSRERVQEVYLRGLRYLSYLAVAAAAGCWLYADNLVTLWLSGPFHDAAAVIRILALGAAVSLPQTAGEAVLLGLGRHRYLLWFLAGEVMSKIALALLLMPTYGIWGMAWANAAPQVALYLLVYPPMAARALELPAGRIWSSQLWPSLAAAATVMISALLMRFLMPAESWPALGVNVLVVLLITLGTGWRLVVGREDRARLLAPLRRNRTLGS